ncbi:YggS family pyridoxal phosphate-dependent enzyme [bacterium]|nr:YggS family pyridoxal phosphate-dependent enzyme [bacterium]NIN92363.1 YggS family pyridoxal phosphate-dependent enzyme [bacterium]NIO18477.1 YggS family pyridoxal phosphate-dependent enzyme [bacterium]NIO73473.1 YggS family pyridoxal phosphate-dependent enzyme [bacterium]
MSVRENLEKVEEKIRVKAELVGRNATEITLVAVTKTVEADRIEQAVAAGVNIIGESRVQEAKEKYGKVKSEVIWHLVGHLQRNKAKDAVKIFDLIHSVDSAKLAKEIDKQARKIDKVQEILIEVNVAGEQSKYGLNPEGVITFLKEVSELPNLKIKGLMTMAPLYENPEDCRPCFRKLKELAEEIRAENIENVEMTYLSMGMSNDFEVAIEEGSNMVRIGRAIFAP